MAGHLRALVTAIALAAAGVTGCGDGQHNAGTAPAPTVPGPELVRLWQHHALPCGHPIGGTDKPADPYHLIEAGMWPTTAEEASRLGRVTATGGPEFVLGRLQLLDVSQPLSR